MMYMHVHVCRYVCVQYVATTLEGTRPTNQSTRVYILSIRARKTHQHLIQCIRFELVSTWCTRMHTVGTVHEPDLGGTIANNNNNMHTSQSNTTRTVHTTSLVEYIILYAHVCVCTQYAYYNILLPLEQLVCILQLLEYFQQQLVVGVCLLYHERSQQLVHNPEKGGIIDTTTQLVAGKARRDPGGRLNNKNNNIMYVCSISTLASMCII